MSEPYYPTVHLDSKDESYEDIPESGTMTVTFRKIRTEESKSDKGTRYSCTLELRKLEDFQSGEAAPPATKKAAVETSDALDMLAKAIKGARDEDEEE